MTTLKMTKTKDRPLSSGDKLRSVDLRVTLVFEQPWDVAERGDSAHDMIKAFAHAYINDTYAVDDKYAFLDAYDPWVPLKKVEIFMQDRTIRSTDEDETVYRERCDDLDKTPTNAGFSRFVLERHAGIKIAFKELATAAS